jgi:hypothetical protein
MGRRGLAAFLRLCPVGLPSWLTGCTVKSGHQGRDTVWATEGDGPSRGCPDASEGERGFALIAVWWVKAKRVHFYSGLLCVCVCVCV